MCRSIGSSKPFIAIMTFGAFRMRLDTCFTVRMNIITEERKLEVPPRETLRMSDTFRYIYVYGIASVYIANRRSARVSSGNDDQNAFLITEERKLEVPPRETLRMSDTFRYIYMYGIASVYIANRRRARASSGIWRILRFRFLPPEIDLNALLCEHLYR